ncbi:ABC-three component system protein [Rhizobium ruizarguesonis]|nr:ABC-three component system protein [Rhizobium ruizarguesonis]
MPDPLGPAEVIAGSSVEGRNGIYVLGCYDRRITFYSQQVRALSLVHALHEHEYLTGAPHIAVIGGGAAGIAAAAAAALASEGPVTLFESADLLLKLQSGTTRRRLDPHIYDWPFSNTEDPWADLPILDWEASVSNTVREEVLQQYHQIEVAAGGRLTTRLRHQVTSIQAIDPSTYQLTTLDLDSGSERPEQFNIVMLAFGFGLEPEERIPGIRADSYWSDAGVPGNEFRGRANPKFFVSGSGDGGLIDLVAAGSANFDHGSMIQTIVRHPGRARVKEVLRQIEREARADRSRGGSLDLFAIYQEQVLPLIQHNGLLGQIAEKLRAGVSLTLQTRDPIIFSLDTSILNRFAAFATIKACEATEGCSFQHMVCRREVARVETYRPAAGEPIYQLDCDGNLHLFDQAIVRRGTESEVVRQPFAGILGTYAADHADWLTRLGDATLVPTLSFDARDFFRGLAREKRLPFSPRRQRLAEAAAPVTIHVGTEGNSVRWAGDLPVDRIDETWRSEGTFHLVLTEGPEELGAVAGTLLRVLAHAPHIKAYGDAARWVELWKAMTAHSPHSTGLATPQIVAGDGGGGAAHRLTTGADRLARMLNEHLDKWLLSQIDRHVRGFLLSQDDPGGAINLEIAQGLRNAMRPIWDEWREVLEDDAPLLARYLRMLACATDQAADAIQVVVGRLKLPALVRGTTLSLAIAACWQGTVPKPDEPGNLRRPGDLRDRTGHSCAADRIGGRSPLSVVERHGWNTNFVLLALEGMLDLEKKAEIRFTTVQPEQPSLADSSGAGPMMMLLSPQMVAALEQGIDALGAYLADLEAMYDMSLALAVLQQKEPA